MCRDGTQNGRDVNGRRLVSHLEPRYFGRWTLSALVELPSCRTRDQVWVVWNLEPPSHLLGDVRPLNGLFNWKQY